MGEGERQRPSADDDPRLRRDRRVGARRRRRPRGKLRPRPRSGRLARSGSAAVHHRRQAEAAGDQQARQHVSAPTVDPWSTGGAALCGGARHAARPMGESANGEDPSQCRGRRLRQQAGEDRLGGPATRRTICRHGSTGGGVRVQAVGRKAPTGKRCLREGDDEMA